MCEEKKWEEPEVLSTKDNKVDKVKNSTMYLSDAELYSKIETKLSNKSEKLELIDNDDSDLDEEHTRYKETFKETLKECLVEMFESKELDICLLSKDDPYSESDVLKVEVRLDSKSIFVSDEFYL